MQKSSPANMNRAHLAVLATNLFFAANYSMIKLISPVLVKPFGLNVFRVSIALLLFWLVWMLGKTRPGIRKEDIGRFFLCGLTGVAINQMLFIKGLTLTSTIHASLLMLTTPLLITLFAFWVLRERITINKASGLLLGITGAVLLVSSREDVAHAPDYLFGDLLILMNAISYSVYFILVKPLMERYSPLHVMRWVFTFGFLLILPFGFVEATEVSLPDFNTGQLFSLAAVILTGTFLAYYFNAFGIQHLGAGITGSYIYTQPVFAVIIAGFMLGEIFTLEKAMAGLLIFAGVFLVGRKKRTVGSN